MIKLRLLMAGIAIAAITATGCSPKVVGDSNASRIDASNIPTEAAKSAESSGGIGNVNDYPTTGAKAVD